MIEFSAPISKGGVVDEVREFEGGVVDGVFRPDFERVDKYFGGISHSKSWGGPGAIRDRLTSVLCYCYKILGGVRGQSGTGLQVCFATLLQNFGGVQCWIPKSWGGPDPPNPCGGCAYANDKIMKCSCCKNIPEYATFQVSFHAMEILFSNIFYNFL